MEKTSMNAKLVHLELSMPIVNIISQGVQSEYPIDASNVLVQRILMY